MNINIPHGAPIGYINDSFSKIDVKIKRCVIWGSAVLLANIATTIYCVWRLHGG